MVSYIIVTRKFYFNKKKKTWMNWRMFFLLLLTTNRSVNREIEFHKVDVEVRLNLIVVRINNPKDYWCIWFHLRYSIPFSDDYDLKKIIIDKEWFNGKYSPKMWTCGLIDCNCSFNSSVPATRVKFALVIPAADSSRLGPPWLLWRHCVRRLINSWRYASINFLNWFIPIDRYDLRSSLLAREKMWKCDDFRWSTIRLPWSGIKFIQLCEIFCCFRLWNILFAFERKFATSNENFFELPLSKHIDKYQSTVLDHLLDFPLGDVNYRHTYKKDFHCNEKRRFSGIYQAYKGIIFTPCAVIPGFICTPISSQVFII